MLETVRERLSDEQVESLPPRRLRDHRGGVHRGQHDRGAARALRPALRGRVRHRHPARRGQLEGRPRPRGPHAADLQRLAGGRRDRRAGAQRADRAARRPADGLRRRAHAPGQLPVEAARRALARHAPGRLLRRLPRPGGDDHLLGGAGRHPRRGRHHRVRTRLAPLAEGRAGSRQLPRARRLARAAARRGARGRGARARAGRGQGRRVLVSPLADVPRLRPQPGGHHRRALVSHLLPAHARFHPTNVDQTYSRYRRRGDLSMDESFFPVVWDATGGRTPWLQELPELP